MAQNVLPQSPGALIVLAGKCAGGLTTYGATLGITQITAASLTADADALQEAIGEFNAARAARTAATAALHAASDAAKDFLSAGRGVLVAHWGENYSQQWAAAGWTDNSTAVPKTQPERLALVLAIHGFLTANASYEVNAPPIVFTAKQALTVSTAMQGALNGMDQADTNADSDKAVRTTLDTQLRKNIRALIGILNLKLTPNDPRWDAFGLNQPGKATTPAAPTGLQSHPALPGQVHLTCDVPPGTDHLRWSKQTDVPGKFVAFTDTADGELLLTGQPSGTTEVIHVQAVNPAGESVPSAPIPVHIA